MGRLNKSVYCSVRLPIQPLSPRFSTSTFLLGFIMRYLTQESIIDKIARIGTVKAGEIITILADNHSIFGELRFIAQCEFSAVDQVEAFRRRHPNGNHLDLVAHLIARGCVEVVSCG